MLSSTESSNAVRYKDGVWVKGDDLFVYGKEEDVEELKFHVEILADSFSVVDKHELKEKYFKNGYFELWECRVGKIQKLYGKILSPHLFLRDPVSGKIYKSISKSFTDNTYTRSLPCQLVTDKVKFTKKVFEYISPIRTVDMYNDKNYLNIRHKQ